MDLKRKVFEYKWALDQKRKASRVNVVNKDNPFHGTKILRPRYLQQMNDKTISWRVNEVRLLASRWKSRFDLLYNQAILIDRFNGDNSFVVKQKLVRHRKDKSVSQSKNFCLITGRSSSVFRKFLVSRFVIRDLVRRGLVRGLMHERYA